MSRWRSTLFVLLIAVAIRPCRPGAGRDGRHRRSDGPAAARRDGPAPERQDRREDGRHGGRRQLQLRQPPARFVGHRVARRIPADHGRPFGGGAHRARDRARRRDDDRRGIGARPCASRHRAARQRVDGDDGGAAPLVEDAGPRIAAPAAVGDSRRRRPDAPGRRAALRDAAPHRRLQRHRSGHRHLVHQPALRDRQRRPGAARSDVGHLRRAGRRPGADHQPPGRRSLQPGASRASSRGRGSRIPARAGSRASFRASTPPARPPADACVTSARWNTTTSAFRCPA